jgi:hypothetical protein
MRRLDYGVPNYLVSAHPPTPLLYIAFVLATAVWNGTAFAWVVGKTQKTTTKMIPLAIALLGMSFWVYMGVTPEELFLMFLPPCISLGIICSYIFGCKQGSQERFEFGDEKACFDFEV